MGLSIEHQPVPEYWSMTMEDDTCPCRHMHLPFRALEENDDEVVLWKILYTCAVLLLMFWVLATDRLGADSVMMAALTAFMASGIITIPEALAGFSNEGLVTVLTLFVVADGISKTGALDWYMAKLLGRPINATSAQARLMVPIGIVSAFLNNTPVVAVMIPVVQVWARNIRVPVQQLLIPLSFATILGGTCTLIGTSTNLVVVGLLQERYPDDPSMSIGLFDLGVYGVPVAMIGMAYILVASPFLLPGGSRRKNQDSASGGIPLDNHEDILLGARLTPWSPAAGRSVKRSGLRDTGGIYLVSVHRAATGNVHRAVGQEFVLNVGDILYFTGLVEGFGAFCEEHGMELLTHEIQNTDGKCKIVNETPTACSSYEEQTINSWEGHTVETREESLMTGQLRPVVEGGVEVDEEAFAVDGGDSLMIADDAERSRAITRMIDAIRGVARDEPNKDEKFYPLTSPRHKDAEATPRRKDADQGGAHRVVVSSEHEFVVVGVDAHDRPGLLLDISKGLSRLNLNLRHTEASVVRTRSISVWRCETVDSEIPDLEEIWSVLNALLERETGSQAVKQRGLRVIRAVITKTSSLVGKNASEVDFRKDYRAAIVAVQKGGRNVSISNVVFGSGDVLVLQVGEDSPLTKIPPADFYKRLKDANKESGSHSRSNSVSSFVNMLAKSISNPNFQKKDNDAVVDLEAMGSNELANVDNSSNEIQMIGSGQFIEVGTGAAADAITSNKVGGMDTTITDELAWKDLQVASIDCGKAKEDGMGAREFLAAMEVAPKSKLANQTIAEIGLDRLPGVFLVSIDRPKTTENKQNKSKSTVITNPSGNDGQDDISVANSLPTEPRFITVEPDSPLMEGDILWFAGSASSLGDLRKIPGLQSHETDEVKKMKEKVHDRRLVEAVVARRGPLVGKTVKEVRFRTRYGAAVIAVHREGNRIHDHPGQIKLQAGDVLLLEAGPTFIRNSMENDRSFALVAEVKDSAPPRLRMLIPALVITVAMLAVYTAEVASLLICALVACMLMVALGVLSEQEARDAINWEVYLTIAAAFGIGTAMVNSGVAGGMANFLVTIGEAIGMGDAGLLGAVYLGTFLISNVVTNNAAAALVFPIAMDAADATGTDLKIMCYCVMLGASASFMSPFGYTTNLLIYGPGGYKFNDFVMIGTPMQIVLWIMSVLFLATTTSTNWWISWAASFVTFTFIVMIQTINPFSFLCKNKDKER